jgi:hypothetical protein
MFEWDRLIDNFSNYYYTPLLMLIVEATALVIGIIYIRKTKIGKTFIFYIAFDFCILIVDCLLISHSGIAPKLRYQLMSYLNNLIALTELLVYYNFFFIILPYSKIKKIMKLLALFFLAIMIIYAITRLNFLTNRFGYITNVIGVTEFIFLLPPCLFYFYNILTVDSEISLLKRPTFWVVTGILFYSLISIPYYLLNKYLSDNDKQLWSALQAALYIIPFTLNFVFLIKAFLCKKTLTI